MRLISVVIPVYNVSCFLNECVQSIVNQTYSNLEIILVDDGSPDKCPEICDEWAKKDSRIRVIHKENGGLSDARNAGLAIATGDYIAFVDSDDYIDKDMLRVLYQSIKENKSDISACGVELVFEDGKRSMLTSDFEGVLNTTEALIAIIKEDRLKQPVWYKLYKREVLKDILFPVGKYNEDVFWSYRVISQAKRISVTNKPLYFYRQRANSIMGNNYSLKRLDGIEAKVIRQHYIEAHFPQLALLAEADLWFSCIYAMQMSLLNLSKEDLNKALAYITEVVKNCKSVTCSGINGLTRKTWFILSKISFIGTCKLRNKLGIGL